MEDGGKKVSAMAVSVPEKAMVMERDLPVAQDGDAMSTLARACGVSFLTEMSWCTCSVNFNIRTMEPGTDGTSVMSENDSPCMIVEASCNLKDLRFTDGSNDSKTIGTITMPLGEKLGKSVAVYSDACGTELGRVICTAKIMGPYMVCDAQGLNLYSIAGRRGLSRITDENTGATIGLIKNQVPAWGKSFKVTFPVEISVERKLLLIAATFWKIKASG